ARVAAALPQGRRDAAGRRLLRAAGLRPRVPARDCPGPTRAQARNDPAGPPGLPRALRHRQGRVHAPRNRGLRRAERPQPVGNHARRTARRRLQPVRPGQRLGAVPAPLHLRLQRQGRAGHRHQRHRHGGDTLMEWSMQGASSSRRPTDSERQATPTDQETPIMSPQAEVVTARLRKTWLQWWTFSFWSGAILAAAVSLATLVLFVLVDALLKLPPRALVSLFAVWAVLSLAAIAQSAAAVADFPFDQAATRENRWRRFLLCIQTPRDLFESFVLLALVLGLAVLCSAVVPAWGSSTRRILHPFTFVPSLGSVKIVKITPGDTEVLIGSSLQIAAEIDNPARKPLPATLFVRQADKPESAQAMLPDETGGKYVAALSQVLAPLHYRLQIGDTQTQLYKVGVYEKPAIAQVEAAYEFPAYLQRPRETVKQNQGDLEVPQFTRAELRIHPSAPIARGHLMIEGNSIDGQVTDDGKTLVAQLLLKDTTTYTIHLFTAGGHSDPQPRVNQVKVVTDAPPTVQLVEPARETTIAVGTKPNVVVRASDDYGLGQVRIESRDDAPTGDKSCAGVKTAASWTKFAVSGVVLDHPLELDPRAMKAGQTVWVRAVAQDRRQLELPELRLGPQESATPWQQIHIVAAEAKAKVEL